MTTYFELALNFAQSLWTSLKCVPRSDGKENDNDDGGGQCDGNEDDEAAAAVEIVLVRSESTTGAGDAQHLLADQGRWRARLGNRSPQVCSIALRKVN